MSDPIRELVMNRDRDCMTCRITSGAGLMGAGLYLCYFARTQASRFGKSVMYSFGIGALGLGTARLLDLKPFHGQFKRPKNESTNEH